MPASVAEIASVKNGHTVQIIQTLCTSVTYSICTLMYSYSCGVIRVVVVFNMAIR